MQFDLIDPVSAKAFWAASQTSSFTRAAKVAFMTQPGVSQHIKRLEEHLGTPLFLRSKDSVILTDSGHALKRYLEGARTGFESLREQIQASQGKLAGDVTYAMPASCMLSPHFPRIMQHRAKHFPNVSLRIRVGNNDDVIQRVQALDVDFGFATMQVRKPSLAYKPYCKERYVLVGPTRLRLGSVDDLRALPLIRYPGAELPFRLWVKERFPRARVELAQLPCVGEIDELSGVLTLLGQNVGYAVVAEHCVAELITKRKTSLADDASVENQIYFVTAANREQPLRVRTVMDAFRVIA